MIDAEEPYCADVDECNDERADFNKLDVYSITLSVFFDVLAEFDKYRDKFK